MCLFVLHLTVPFQHHVQFVSVLTVDTVIGLIVKPSSQVYPKAFSLTDLPPAACIDMMPVQVICLSGYVAFLLGLHNAFTHWYQSVAFQLPSSNLLFHNWIASSYSSPFGCFLASNNTYPVLASQTTHRTAAASQKTPLFFTTVR